MSRVCFSVRSDGIRCFETDGEGLKCFEVTDEDPNRLPDDPPPGVLPVPGCKRVIDLWKNGVDILVVLGEYEDETGNRFIGLAYYTCMLNQDGDILELDDMQWGVTPISEWGISESDIVCLEGWGMTNVTWPLAIVCSSKVVYLSVPDFNLIFDTSDHEANQYAISDPFHSSGTFAGAGSATEDFSVYAGSAVSAYDVDIDDENHTYTIKSPRGYQDVQMTGRCSWVSQYDILLAGSRVDDTLDSYATCKKMYENVPPYDTMCGKEIPLRSASGLIYDGDLSGEVFACGEETQSIPISIVKNIIDYLLPGICIRSGIAYPKANCTSVWKTTYPTKIGDVSEVQYHLYLEVGPSCGECTTEWTLFRRRLLVDPIKFELGRSIPDGTCVPRKLHITRNVSWAWYDTDGVIVCDFETGKTANPRVGYQYSIIVGTHVYQAIDGEIRTTPVDDLFG